MPQQTKQPSKQTSKRLAPFPSEADVHTWAAELDAVTAKLAPHFERAEPRQRVLAYLTGLLSTTERKNGWQLAELAGEATPDGMRRRLSTAHWDADAVRDDLVAYVVEHLADADADAVLVLDETGFVKKGTKSVGVAPQYCGTVGTIATCQIGVFLAYATSHGPVLLDRELYLPREWADDPARRAEAGVPAEASGIPNPALGKELLERAYAAGVRAAWVTADSVYGGAYQLRHSLEERAQPFVLAVPSTQRVGLSAKAAQVVAAWPAAAWQRRSAGEGSQSPRWYDWAWMPMAWRLAPEGMAHWLLARRSLSKPDELAYYFVFGPASATLAQVVQVAGMRWHVEQAFELAKGEVGLDEYEVRTWVGWYRHITLAMFALAYLTVVRVHAQRTQQERQRPKGGAATGRSRRGRRRDAHSACGPAAADRAGGAAPALRAGLAAAPFRCARLTLVRLAPPPPGTRQTGAYQAAATTTTSATVVLAPLSPIVRAENDPTAHTWLGRDLFEVARVTLEAAASGDARGVLTPA